MFPIEPLAVAGAVFLLATVGLAIGVWVGLDARARGSSAPALWGTLAPVSGIVLAYYLGWWRGRHDRDRPASGRQRSAGVVAAAGVAAFPVAALVAPPDPYTQLFAWSGVFVCCLPVTYLLVGRFPAENSA